MELREWLIILGLVLVTIIVVDGVRRLQRQRRVPRLDQAGQDEGEDGSAVADPEEEARRAEINWELPNGGARVVRPATQPTVAPKPKLQRQEHPGPSKVFSRMAQEQEQGRSPEAGAQAKRAPAASEPRQKSVPARAERDPAATTARAEATRANAKRADDPYRQRIAAERSADARPPHVDTGRYRYEPAEEETQGRFGSGMKAALRSGSQRVSQSVQKVSSAFQRHEEHEPHPHREPSLGDASDFSASREVPEESCPRPAAGAFESPFEPVTPSHDEEGSTRTDVPRADDAEPHYAGPTEAGAEHEDDVVTPHPVVEKARRHHVSAQRARETLAHAEEVIVISVMARDEAGFSGTGLLNLMLACGLRYSEMGIFLRYETEDADSELQFAMVDVVKPGIFDLESMDDYATPGVTFLMPLPGAQDSAAAFEAMVETAMVLVRNMGGELKDENRSVMTAQTVEFSRQRVQEFERRHRLHRYHAT